MALPYSIRYIKRKLWSHRKRVIIAAVLTFCVMGLELTPPLLFFFMVDNVLTKGEYHWFIPVLILMMLVPIVLGGCRLIADFLVSIVGQRLLFDMRLDLYQHVQWLSTQYMQRNTAGRVMERLRGDVAQIQSIINTRILMMMREVVVGVVAIVVIWWFSWHLGMMLIFGLSLYLMNLKWFIPRIRATQRRYRRKMDNLSTLALERLHAAELVQASVTTRQESRRFLKENFKTERVYTKFRILNSSYTQTTMGTLWVTYAMMLCFGTLLIFAGEMTYAMLVPVAMYTQKLVRPMVMLSEMSNQIQQARVALSRMFEMMHAEVDPAAEGGKRINDLRGEIKIDNVSFAYLKDRPVLQNVSLHVKPGETLALVGRTGCGKSTMTRLLYRYYEPTEGRILIDGHDLVELDARQYRSHVAMVPQDPLVFNMTIRENINYGNHHATEEQMQATVKLAGLTDTLAHLHDGLDTVLGEDGVTLSLGERQRVCLARAILADPRVLILDEATSSLDAIHEAEIQPVLNEAMQGRTCIVIAHRLSTIRHADQIAMIDEGRVVEHGTHEALMEIEGGRYRRMYLTQAGVIQQATQQVLEASV